MWIDLDLTSDGMYLYFIDNHKTRDHQSLIFGVRELNASEVMSYCVNQSWMNNSSGAVVPPVTDEVMNFTSDYDARVYTSGCYYFDEETNAWSSDGMLVSVFVF